MARYNRLEDRDRVVSFHTETKNFVALTHHSLYLHHGSGASYCDVRYDFKTSPRPTIDQPLGVPFPGSTWAEPQKPNWVGHLVTKLKEQQTSIIVYNFAHGGDTTDEVDGQINKIFIPGLVVNRAERVWDAATTLFCKYWFLRLMP